MDKQTAVMETSFWVLGHRVDILTYLLRFFDLVAPQAVRIEVLAPDSRYPQRVYGYQEMWKLLETQQLLTIRNPVQAFPHFHTGEAAAMALAQEQECWLLINEQRPLAIARQRDIKTVTVPEFIVYLYEARTLSYRSARSKLNGIAPNTGYYVMQSAQQALQAVAENRGEGESS